MKVKDLIAELSELNPEFEVVLSSDSEGNNYSPLAGCDIGRYSPETTWRGDWTSVGDPGAPEEEIDGCTPEQANAVALWPVN